MFLQISLRMVCESKFSHRTTKKDTPLEKWIQLLVMMANEGKRSKLCAAATFVILIFSVTSAFFSNRSANLTSLIDK